MDVDLLKTIIQNNDLVAIVVRRLDEEYLMSISSKEIQKFFSLEPFLHYHIPIDLLGPKKKYSLKKDKVKQGALRAHLAPIGNLPLVVASKNEPFKKEFFTSISLEIYMTLFRVFSKDEQSFVRVKFMYMMAWISSFGVDIFVDFASYIVEEIHIGLVGINKGKVEKNFGNYSLLMHMFFFKGVTHFGKEMVLNKKHEEEALLVQLWSVDID